MFRVFYKGQGVQVHQTNDGRNILQLESGAQEGATPDKVWQMVTGSSSLLSSSVATQLSAQAFVRKRAESDERYQNLPPATQAIVSYCEANHLPVCVGPNTKETLAGCDDASLVRDRIVAAQESVPVCDEMKSLFLAFSKRTPNSPDRTTVYVMIHFRGNRLFDNKKVQQVLRNLSNEAGDPYNYSGTSVKSLAPVTNDQLAEKFTLTHGTVTPFIEAHREQFADEVKGTEIIHIFDEDCLRSFGMGMTTNAHDASWATEFKPWEVIPKMQSQAPHTIKVADIVQDGPSQTLAQVQNFQGRTIGVIEYGFAATQLFRKRLEHHRKKILASLTETHYTLQIDEKDGTTKRVVSEQPVQLAGTFSELRVRVVSEPSLEDVMAPEAYATDVKNRVDGLLAQLVSQGADTIMLPCNILPKYVTNYFGNNLQILSISEALEAFFETEIAPSQSYALLGGQSVNSEENTVYSTALKSSAPFSNAEQAQIEDAMMSINNDQFPEADRILFDVLKNKSIEAIVVAATSLSVAYHQRGCQLLDPENFNAEEQADVQRINEIKVIDTLDVYAEYCAQALFQPTKKVNH